MTPQSRSISLEEAFGAEGKRLAALMRSLLPIATLEKGPRADQARRTLQREADATSARLVKASQTWLKSDVISSQVVKGQQEAAEESGIIFGGPNLSLIDRLTREIASDLIPAAASPRLYVDRALTKGKAIAVEKFDSWASEIHATSNLDTQMTASLLRGSLAQETPEQMGKRILADLGLDSSDRILLAGGRSYEADYYAELLADTRSKQALNLGKAEDLTKRGMLYIQTSEHSGVKEDDICFELQGRVWALSANDLGIPVIPYLPPWHPWCGHTIGAWVPEIEGQKAVDSALSDHEDDQTTLAPFRGDDGGLRSYKK